MKLKKLTADQWIRFGVLAVCLLFCLGSLVWCCIGLAKGRELSTVLTCIASIALLFIPELSQKLFRFKMSTLVYLLILIYAVTPTLGHSYEWYTKVKGWDKFMHTTGGIVFAMFGAYLPKLFCKKEECNLWVCILFGFCFSIMISVLWEFYEYFCDTFLGKDMQKDTILSIIHSYKISDNPISIIGSQNGITGVIVETVNGQVTLPVNGYLDIGLVDTMHDMLVETLGALVYCVAYIIDKGKYTAFHYIPKTTEQKTE
ncbi:MAG: hypothetical protein IJX88_01530 [Clostridia bacterium]|nr:hypothetical protein [Clostridia bacterium]